MSSISANQSMWLASSKLTSKYQLFSAFHDNYCIRSHGSFKLHSKNRKSHKKAARTAVPRCSQGNPEAGGGNDKQPLETILRLYNAIKERNQEDLSELIGDECRGFCNFIPVVEPLEGKKQVLELFFMLMRSMGDNVAFVIKPSIQEGMVIGVEWHLEWEKTGTPIGKGYSFHTAHLYTGKVLIRNMEVIMEPLLQLEPLRLKLKGFLVPIMDRIASKISMDKKGKKVFLCSLLVMLVMAISFIVFKDLPL